MSAVMSNPVFREPETLGGARAALMDAAGGVEDVGIVEAGIDAVSDDDEIDD